MNRRELRTCAVTIVAGIVAGIIIVAGLVATGTINAFDRVSNVVSNLDG